MTEELPLNISRERMNYFVTCTRIFTGEKKSDVYFTPCRKHKFQVFKRHKYKNENFKTFRRKCKRKKYIGRYLYDLSIEKEYLNKTQKRNP